MNIAEALAKRFTYRDKASWLELIHKGQILWNQKVATGKEVVQKGDLLVYLIKNHVEPEVNKNYKVVYKTPDFMLVDKPSDIPVHRTGKIFFNTLTTILREDFKEEELSPLHRLDRETGGLMLYARSSAVRKMYQRILDQLISRKLYVALVHGKIPKGDQLVELPLSDKTETPIRNQMLVHQDGKECSTHFWHLGSVQKDEASFSLVLAELLTGRKHQIRAHLAHLGFPIVGDKIYAHQGKFYLKRLDEELKEVDFNELGAKHHLLQSWAMELQLPNSQKQFYFSNNFSEEWSPYLDLFENWKDSALAIIASLEVTSRNS